MEKIYSSVLKEDRPVWVHIPQSYHKDKDSTRRYPVLYLMDGSDHFTSVVGMLQRLSEASGNDFCPDMIVVGIPNTDRMRDLTPSHVAGGPYLAANMVRTSGGGEAFMAFMEKELIPHIDSTCPASPYRLLVGHSLGGLMVVDALINHRELFSAYLAIDPSLWWDDQKLLKKAEGELAPGSFRNKAFFLAIANTMQAGMDTLQVQKDTARGSIHIRSILRFENDLQKAGNSGLRWDYKYYRDDTHGSVPLIAEYDAFRFLFSFYHFPEQNQVFDSACTADSALRLITAHYRLMTERMGYAILPPQGLVNSLAHNFLQNKMPDKAFAFFTLNIRNYPKSVDAYANMGDYYVAKADKRKALEYYNKALVIGDNPDWVREKIEKLNPVGAGPSH
ncbi:MAG: alpha/beta hydrolase-fold protein [Bacteroidota bacterium]|nr:alpha/beta hydrolase-fold protein [Bacteroidota bacterium]MDP4218311.1 alpha/beta hydrolase-fold protein [Bacteroidota bacterium]MDP4247980.1 alpha/beta hydrolase-fold protein [Bacteroidota bacterium]MDP4253888.1 alpha/beta hydrolase-fold protein [Bacteroidota bacterium]